MAKIVVNFIIWSPEAMTKLYSKLIFGVVPIKQIKDFLYLENYLFLLKLV